MTPSPRVSVLLTSYNHAPYLAQSIESVLGQSFNDLELIIWDDASTDESWSIIKSYSDKRLRAFRSPKNTAGGYIPEMARMARGEYVAILHSDDYWVRSKIAKQVKVLDARPDIGACFTHVKVLHEGGFLAADISRPDLLEERFSQPNRNRYQWLRKFFFEGNFLCHPSVLLRRSCLESAGGYSNALYQLPDFHMWIRICMLTEVYVINQELICYRWFGDLTNQSARTPEAKIRSSHEYYHVLSEYKKLSVEDLLRVFPEGSYFLGNRLHAPVPEYMLAMVALSSQQSGIVQKSFGADLLTKCLMNHATYNSIVSVHGVTTKHLLKPELLVDHYGVLAQEKLKRRYSDLLSRIESAKLRSQHELEEAKILQVRLERLERLNFDLVSSAESFEAGLINDLKTEKLKTAEMKRGVSYIFSRSQSIFSRFTGVLARLQRIAK